MLSHLTNHGGREQRRMMGNPVSLKSRVFWAHFPRRGTICNLSCFFSNATEAKRRISCSGNIDQWTRNVSVATRISYGKRPASPTDGIGSSGSGQKNWPQSKRTSLSQPNRGQPPVRARHPRLLSRRRRLKIKATSRAWPIRAKSSHTRRADGSAVNTSLILLYVAWCLGAAWPRRCQQRVRLSSWNNPSSE